MEPSHRVKSLAFFARAQVVANTLKNYKGRSVICITYEPENRLAILHGLKKGKATFQEYMGVITVISKRLRLNPRFVEAQGPLPK